MLCNRPPPSVPRAEPGTFSRLPPSLGLFRVTLSRRDQTVLAAFLQRWEKKKMYLFMRGHTCQARVWRSECILFPCGSEGENSRTRLAQRVFLTA